MKVIQSVTNIILFAALSGWMPVTAAETKPQNKSKVAQACAPEVAKPSPSKQDCQQKPASEAAEKTADVEKKVEEERLKVLFVDVNKVFETFGSTLDWTANTLDGYFADEETQQQQKKAKTWGHIVFGWEPREGNLNRFPVKFKVKAKLPHLKDKVELILSDNEDDDFKTLPYESVRPETVKLDEDSFGAAIRFLHATRDNISTSSRLGWGDNQLYARSSARYKKAWYDNKLSINLQPALEYYVVDGWGGRFLFDIGYKLSDNSDTRFNFSYRDLESFSAPKWRAGVFQINAVTDKSAMIVGISSNGETKPKFTPMKHRFSVRYRFNALRSWTYFEIEPFVEVFRPDLPDNSGIDYNASFIRDTGITFRFEGHYGFN